MLGRLIRHRLIPRRGITASGFDARALLRRGVAGCGALMVLGAGGYTATMQPPPGGAGSGNAALSAAAARDAGSFKQIILPDPLIVSPSGLTDQQLTQLGRVSGVRNLVSFDGAEIRTGTQPVSVIGVNPAQFRSWVPLRTASDQAFWTALAHIAASRGQTLSALVAATDAARGPGQPLASSLRVLALQASRSG